MTEGRRARADQRAQRVNVAAELLASGVDVAGAVRALARRFHLSERQARRYMERAQSAGVATGDSSGVSSGGNIVPGGLWISPSNSFTIVGTSRHFAAHAYPTHPGDPPIKLVNFTASWPAATWRVACSATKASQGDIFACDWSLAGLPAAAISHLTVSFDVYDVAGNFNLAPNGLHVEAGAGAPQPAPPGEPGPLLLHYRTWGLMRHADTRDTPQPVSA